MSNIIDTLEQEQFKQNLPNFNPGDTLVVQVKVREGNRERLQAFEGVCIAKRNRHWFLLHRAQNLSRRRR